jgi:hypothetical protein
MRWGQAAADRVSIPVRVAARHCGRASLIGALHRHGVGGAGGAGRDEGDAGRVRGLHRFRGIWVISPQGQRVGVIRVPEVPRNLAFGGPDARTLFITAGKSPYSLPTKVVGIGAF